MFADYGLKVEKLRGAVLRFQSSAQEMTFP